MKNLELTHREISLLLDSVHSRIRQVDKLLTCFDDPKLVVLYSKDRIELDELETKIVALWNK